ncbi:ATP-binding protein [Niabella hibiscisoli]|uniref:ATP-binding protein n=2 Tax=Niabella hibiscisoli TaxID=1825928 RepID=UPI001F0E7033|nr:ATP-binding protein [Niabella hibiscisoli]MCH5719851.1 ATP-binding protein [Niabella hibiscisoli]
MEQTITYDYNQVFQYFQWQIYTPGRRQTVIIERRCHFAILSKTYKFYGPSIASIARLIGNAVPPEYARHIGMAIKNMQMQFRTKARAVDLLGKGQIADLPTAITELWKNGYDAYADSLRADLYKEGYKGLSKTYFAISDDGKGMSDTDILDKWLVLGTDSKSRAELEQESEDTLWKKPRIKAGEKGIGRLSVAYLGNPMLMLTKKMGYPLQAVYFDWRLLENYNLFLDDIVIPIQSVENIELLETAFSKLKRMFLSNFDKESDADGNPIWEDKQIDLKSVIISETKNTILEEPVLNHISSFFTQMTHTELCS